MQSTEKLDIKSFLFISYVIYLENYGVSVISCYKFHFE